MTSTFTSFQTQIIELRTAKSFRIYVILFDVLAILTLLFTIKAVFNLKKKQIFNSSSTYLLVSSLGYSNLHNLSYGLIENWSLYRSHVYSDNPDAILFTSEECFVQHVLNSCSRLSIIFIEISLNIDRIIALIIRNFRFQTIQGSVLNTITFISSLALGCFLHQDGPPPDVKTTSCFREKDLTIDLCSTNLLSYTTAAIVCMVLDIIMMVYISITRRNKVYNINLNSKYHQLEQYNSLMAVSVISLVQMLGQTFYTISMMVLARYEKEMSKLVDANFLRWIFPTPYISFIMPLELLFLIWWIGNNRRNKIKNFKKQVANQDGYFNQLSDAWRMPEQKQY